VSLPYSCWKSFLVRDASTTKANLSAPPLGELGKAPMAPWAAGLRTEGLVENDRANMNGWTLAHHRGCTFVWLKVNAGSGVKPSFPSSMPGN
jgi:hypothetical protein